MEERKKAKNVIAIVILSVCLLGAAYFAAVTIIDIMARGQGQSFYDSLPARSVSAPGTEQRDRQENADWFTETGTAQPGSQEAGQGNGQGSGEQEGVEPGEQTEEPAFMSAVDFEAIAVDCPDIIAWIFIEDTIIDYPVMQGSDNQYYLNHLPNGASNKMGSIFMDCNNTPDFTDDVTYLYGHHMKSGEMFAILKSYGETSFYEAHRIINIYTPFADYEVEVFAGYIVSASMERPPMRFGDERAFNDYLNMITSRSILKSDVGVSYGDRLVSLVTCNYNVDNGRLILVGKVRW